jgi:hypothetical protein
VGGLKEKALFYFKKSEKESAVGGDFVLIHLILF